MAIPCLSIYKAKYWLTYCQVSLNQNALCQKTFNNLTFKSDISKSDYIVFYSGEESIELKLKLNRFLLQMKIGITGGESNFYDCSVQPFMVHREVIPNLFDIISQYFTDTVSILLGGNK